MAKNEANLEQKLKELTESKVAAENYADDKDSGGRVQLIVFKLGGEEYALPIDNIKEVVLTPSIAQMPHTPDYIKGVANIRGNVIAIMDMEERFHLKHGNSSDVNKANYTLVIESDEFKVGILVREVPNTLTVKISEIDSSSSVMQFSQLDGECIKGIAKVDNRLIILVDVFKMIATNELLELTN